MRIKYYSFSNKGGRERNEDYISSFVNEDENGDTGIFILADGLGGHKSGDVASEFVVRSMMTQLKRTKNVDIETISTIMKTTNDLLLESQNQFQYKNMKSTAVLLYINENRVICAHIGDSRLYCFSGGRLQYVTPDHSVSYKKYLQGEITYDSIRVDEDRSSLIKVMGNKERFEPAILDLTSYIKKDGNFLLCSDGFWEYMDDNEMLVDLVKSRDPKEWADYMFLRHITRTKSGNDNFSTIMVFVE